MNHRGGLASGFELCHKEGDANDRVALLKKIFQNAERVVDSALRSGIIVVLYCVDLAPLERDLMVQVDSSEIRHGKVAIAGGTMAG